MKPFRKLNDEGLEQFEEWLAAGAPGSVPLQLLTGAATSEPVGGLTLGTPDTADRYRFGGWLVEALNALDPVRLSVDRLLWSSLGLLWFDHLCPPRAMGRDVKRSYRYVLSAGYRDFYRHLVRTPWQLVSVHGEAARFLLLGSADRPNPLSVGGDIVEQLASRQQVLRSRSLIAEAARLYGDPETGRPRKGVAGNTGGSVRRLGLVLKQLDLTWDVDAMSEGGLLAILPREFDRYQA